MCIRDRNTTVPIEELGKFMNVRFVNNSASLAGDAIYGGSIDFCYTLKAFSYNGTRKLFYSKYIFQTIFNMAEQTGSSNISSNPHGVCFCDLVYSGEQCRLVVANLTKFPGQKFNVSVTTVGQFSGRTIGVIDASFTNGHPTDELISLNNPSAHKGCVNLTYKVHSIRAITMIINFTAIYYS